MRTLIVVSVAFLALACSKQHKETQLSSIRIADKSQMVHEVYADETFVEGFTFIAETEWHMSIGRRLGDDIEWIKPSVADGYSGGAGTHRASFIITQNYTHVSRSVSVIIQVEGDRLVVIITQQPVTKNGVLLTDPDDFGGADD